MTGVWLKVRGPLRAEPGFARHEPEHGAVGAAKKDGFVGEPWVPPRYSASEGAVTS